MNILEDALSYQWSGKHKLGLQGVATSHPPDGYRRGACQYQGLGRVCSIGNSLALLIEITNRYHLGKWFDIFSAVEYVHTLNLKTLLSGHTVLHVHQYCASSRCSIFSPAWSMLVSVFTFSLTSGCVVVSHCGINLHFSNDLWCRTIFHISYFYVFGKVFFQIFWPFNGLSFNYYWFVGVLCIFWVQILCLVYVLWIYLSQVCKYFPLCFLLKVFNVFNF